MDRTSQIAFILSKVKGLPQVEAEMKVLADLLETGKITLKQLFEAAGIVKETVFDAIVIYQILYGQRPKDDALNNWNKAELEGKIFWLDKKKRCLYYDPT